MTLFTVIVANAPDSMQIIMTIIGNICAAMFLLIFLVERCCMPLCGHSALHNQHKRVNFNGRQPIKKCQFLLLLQFCSYFVGNFAIFFRSDRLVFIFLLYFFRSFSCLLAARYIDINMQIILLLLLLLLFLALCICCLCANYFVVAYKTHADSRLPLYTALLTAPCNTRVCCKCASGETIKRQPTRLITRFKEFTACFSQSCCCAPTHTYIHV